MVSTDRVMTVWMWRALSGQCRSSLHQTYCAVWMSWLVPIRVSRAVEYPHSWRPAHHQRLDFTESMFTGKAIMGTCNQPTIMPAIMSFWNLYPSVARDGVVVWWDRLPALVVNCLSQYATSNQPTLLHRCGSFLLTKAGHLPLTADISWLRLMLTQKMSCSTRCWLVDRVALVLILWPPINILPVAFTDVHLLFTTACVICCLCLNSNT